MRNERKMERKRDGERWRMDEMISHIYYRYLWWDADVMISRQMWKQEQCDRCSLVAAIRYRHISLFYFSTHCEDRSDHPHPSIFHKAIFSPSLLYSSNMISSFGKLSSSSTYRAVGVKGFSRSLFLESASHLTKQHWSQGLCAKRLGRIHWMWKVAAAEEK